MPPRISWTLDVLLARATPEPNTGCWVWDGACTDRGYGRVDVLAKAYRAHRLAFKLAYGYEPENVLHKCDNPPCIWPGHLYDGSRGDNILDSYRRGRRPLPHGEDCNFAKLTEVKVREIRRLREEGWQRKAIAARFGLSIKTIDSIVYRVSWRWLDAS